MPCDLANNIYEYTSVWEEIIDTCENLQCDNVIIGGDFNTSVDRPHSSFTKYLTNVVRRENLFMCVDNNVSRVDFTFTCPVGHSTHTIDHFIVNSALSSNVTMYHSLHDGDNLSFHSAVSLELNINVSYLAVSERVYVPKPKWSCATDKPI